MQKVGPSIHVEQHAGIVDLRQHQIRAQPVEDRPGARVALEREKVGKEAARDQHRMTADALVIGAAAAVLAQDIRQHLRDVRGNGGMSPRKTKAPSLSTPIAATPVRRVAAMPSA